MKYFFVLFFLFLLQVRYFKLANRFGIIDKPNQRSLHTEITIRGGGVIFPISILIFFFISGFEYPYFTLGLIIISLISFWDDIQSISIRIRIFAQIISVYLLLFQFDDLPHYSFLEMFIIFFVMIGILNAFNFMDGINGITGGYSLCILISFWIVNNYFSFFIENELIIILFLGILVFNYFNFRIKALCFAGDIGSISIAFIIVFLLLKLIIQTNLLVYIFFISLYGLDTIITIFTRIIHQKNIFQPHNDHLYQSLVRKINLSHTKVSLMYAIIQLILNIILIFAIKLNLITLFTCFMFLPFLFYVFLRYKILSI